jgi:hypothetical protein
MHAIFNCPEHSALKTPNLSQHLRSCVLLQPSCQAQAGDNTSCWCIAVCPIVFSCLHLHPRCRCCRCCCCCCCCVILQGG